MKCTEMAANGLEPSEVLFYLFKDSSLLFGFLPVPMLPDELNEIIEIITRLVYDFLFYNPSPTRTVRCQNFDFRIRIQDDLWIVPSSVGE